MLTKLVKALQALALVDVMMLYPSYGLRLIVVDLSPRELQIGDSLYAIDLMINSQHDSQKKASQQALDSLINSLGIDVPGIIHHQPPQVTAAAYARLLKQYSWSGWMFACVPSKVPLLAVKTIKGVSAHHHKHYINYRFESDNTERSREAVLEYDYWPEDQWWYRDQLNANPIELPDNFLLWLDDQGNDRGDIEDANTVAESLNIQNKRLLQAVFYQIKFEMADVICCDYFYNRHSENLPGNLFDRDPQLMASLSGLLVRYFRLHGHRPNVVQIYHAGVNNRLPNKAWNGKWVSHHRQTQ